MNTSERLQPQYIERKRVRRLTGPKAIIAEAGLVIPFLLAACSTPGSAVTTEAPVTQTPESPVPTMTASPSTLIVENPQNSPEITDSVSLEILQKQQEIEQKYGIDLMSKNEPLAQVLEKDTPVEVDEWTGNQLSVIDHVLSLTPPKLYESINGIKLKIFIGSTEDECSGCVGLEYKKSRIVGFKNELVTESNKDGLFTLAIHEFTHGLDHATDNSLWPKVNEILGDKTFLKLKEFKENQGEPVGSSYGAEFIAESLIKGKKIDLAFIQELIKSQKMDPLVIQKREDQKMAVRTLASFASDKSFSEGIAGLSQTYILGQVRFLEALGPVLDGNGYDNNEDTNNPTIERLTHKYPKAEALYELYENSVFDGKEYNPNSNLASKN